MVAATSQSCMIAPWTGRFLSTSTPSAESSDTPRCTQPAARTSTRAGLDGTGVARRRAYIHNRPLDAGTHYWRHGRRPQGLGGQVLRPQGPHGGDLVEVDDVTHDAGDSFRQGIGARMPQAVQTIRSLPCDAAVLAGGRRDLSYSRVHGKLPQGRRPQGRRGTTGEAVGPGHAPRRPRDKESGEDRRGEPQGNHGPTSRGCPPTRSSSAPARSPGSPESVQVTWSTENFMTAIQPRLKGLSFDSALNYATHRFCREGPSVIEGGGFGLANSSFNWIVAYPARDANSCV